MERKGQHACVIRGMLLSCTLHTLCIAGMVVFGAATANQPETIRVSLILGLPGIDENRAETIGKAKEALSPPGRKRRGGQSASRPVRVAPCAPPAEVAPPKNTEAAEGQTPAENLARYAIPTDAAAPAVERADGLVAGGANASRGGGKEDGVHAVMGSRTGAEDGPGLAVAGRSRQGPAESPERMQSRYLGEHFAYIREVILSNLVYPPLAKKLGWQGHVKVSFVIREDGKVEGVRIVESSGYDVLDRNLVETILSVQPFPRPPTRAELVLPVAYVLKPRANGNK